MRRYYASRTATAPIRAGIRARAVAEACEKLGVAAILIDGMGHVLHVGQTAAALLGDRFRVAAGHLVGETRAANDAVQQAVTAAVGDVHPPQADVLPDGDLIITGLRYKDPSPFQLLRGVLVLGRKDKRSIAGLKSLRTLLAT